LTSGFLEALRIPLPPLAEQRRIVDLLGRAAGIRRLREQALAKAREIVPALFLTMFGDPATNPKGWPVVRLGEVIAGFEGGKNLLAGDAGDSKYQILKISAVTGGIFRLQEAKPAPKGYSPPTSHLVRKGDLLITRANTVDLVGAIARVEYDVENLLLPDKIWRFRWREPSPVLSEYIAAIFLTTAIRAELRLLATGTSDSMRNISQSRLLMLRLPLPPLPLQQAFAARVAEVRGIVAQAERGLAAARALEGALMARLLG
jgi:type I restriction enzyme S subunit